MGRLRLEVQQTHQASCVEYDQQQVSSVGEQRRALEDYKELQSAENPEEPNEGVHVPRRVLILAARRVEAKSNA